MNVVGHNNKGVHFDAGETLPQRFPNPASHSSRVIQAHLVAGHVAETTCHALSDNGDEIGACLGVVIPLQADGPAAVDAQVIVHAAAVPGRPKGSPLRLAPVGIGLGEKAAV